MSTMVQLFSRKLHGNYGTVIVKDVSGQLWYSYFLGDYGKTIVTVAMIDGEKRLVTM